MYIPPSSGEPLPHLLNGLYGGLRLFLVSGVRMLHFLKIHSNPPILYYGFNGHYQKSHESSNYIEIYFLKYLKCMSTKSIYFLQKWSCFHYAANCSTDNMF